MAKTTPTGAVDTSKNARAKKIILRANSIICQEQGRQAKIFTLRFSENHELLRPSRLAERGVARVSSRHVRRGCDGRVGSQCIFCTDERCRCGREIVWS